MESRDCWRPALLTTISRPPSPSTARCTSCWRNALVAEVARDRQTDPALCLDQRDDLLRVGLFGREIIDRDVGAFARVGDGRGTAHAGIAAGDQRLSTREPAGAAVALLAMIGTWVHFARKARPGLRLPLVGRFGIFASGVPEFRSGHALVPFAISGIETRCWCRGRRSLQGAFARVARHQHPNKPIVAASWNICRRRA